MGGVMENEWASNVFCSGDACVASSQRMSLARERKRQTNRFATSRPGPQKPLQLESHVPLRRAVIKDLATELCELCPLAGPHELAIELSTADPADGVVLFVQPDGHRAIDDRAERGAHPDAVVGGEVEGVDDVELIKLERHERGLFLQLPQRCLPRFFVAFDSATDGLPGTAHEVAGAATELQEFM